VVRAFVAVGSNINAAENVEAAIRLLSERARVLAISTVYRTRPVARPEQPDYYNCVVEIETETAPADFKRTVLRGIERKLGRTRGQDKFAARTVDLDLVLYGDLVIRTKGLTLPDPEILSRPFLAAPLCELAPDLVIPGSGMAVSQVAESLPRDEMTPLLAYTEHLRREIAHGHPES